MTFTIPHWVFSEALPQAIVLICAIWFLVSGFRRVRHIDKVMTAMALRHDDHAAATHKSFLILAQGMAELGSDLRKFNNDPNDDTFLEVGRNSGAAWSAPAEGTPLKVMQQIRRDVEKWRAAQVPASAEVEDVDDGSYIVDAETVDPRMRYPKPARPLEVPVGGQVDIEV